MPANLLYLLALLLISLSFAHAGPSGCPDTGQAGATCDSGGAASQGNGSDTEQGAGNPINVITGNKYQREVDQAALPGLLGIEVVRHYNSSQARRASSLGHGWRLSYDTRLAIFSGSLRVQQADGGSIDFQRSSSPGHYQTSDARHGKIGFDARAQRYLWVWPSGRILLFDRSGRLESIQLASGEALNLQRDSQGRLLQVTDPQGRSLQLSYARNGQLTGIRSPLGEIRYRYDDRANLASAERPQGLHRYHYEDGRFSHHLTGISDRTTRLSSWAYDAAGLGILSVKGAPLRRDGKGQAIAGTGLEQVSLQHTWGRTTLTNSLGQTTIYRHTLTAGGPRLLEVRGPGCSSCGPSNRRYEYDGAGRLTQEIYLDDKGQAQSGERRSYDPLGRLRQRSRVTYRAGRASEPTLLARFGYDLQWVSSRDPQVAALEVAFNLPIQIARPSVVAGREAHIQLAYNALGQLTRREETGYSPLNAKGEPATPATASPIARASSYQYLQRNGRSLLAASDGPLPNGPKGSSQDSDITEYVWDGPANYLAGVRLPLGGASHIQRDPASGRIVQLVDARGLRSQYHYRQPGQLKPSAIERAGQTLSYRYDGEGRLVQVGDAPQRQLHLQYDVAGKLVAARDAQGYVQTLDLDGEGRVLRGAQFEPGQTQPLRAAYWKYDAQGKPAFHLLPDGRLQTWTENSYIDGDEVLQQKLPAGGLLRISPDGAIELQRQQPATSKLPSPGNQQSWRDDFGRVVRWQSADHGIRIARYDALDHLVHLQRQDASGKLLGYSESRYDAAGRLLDQRGEQSQTRHYQNGQLSQQSDPTESRQHHYDGQGRLIRQQIAFYDPAGKLAWQGELGRQYGANGQTSAQTLLDGQVLRNHSDPATGMLRGISLQTAFWARIHRTLEAWLPGSIAATLQGWLPQQTVLRDLQAHPFNGIRAYTLGNGLKLSQDYDLAGRLRQIAVTGTQGSPHGYPPSYLYRLQQDFAVGPRVRSQQLDLLGQPRRERNFRYAGFGTLQMPNLQTVAHTPQRTQRRNKQGQLEMDGKLHYRYTAQGQIESVMRAERLIARYRYNHAGQRVAKTIYAESDSKGQTTWTLWQEGQRVAEINEAGQILAQYLYLHDKGRAIPIAKLQDGQIYYIHSDQRAAPLMMSDAKQAVVWRAEPDAWGWSPPHLTKAAKISLNLRLPGQYYDNETGLHDNWHRSYDARPDSSWRGRYLSPDPLGYPDGPDPYAYGNGDPVNRIDPMGLYQSDIHYYMTFFLAVAAGMDVEDASIVALAAQYIDDNPDTRPLDEDNWITKVGSIFHNQQNLLKYHFTLSDNPENHLSPRYGKTNPAYDNNNINNPSSVQLNNLENASKIAPTACAKLVFLGEYLHAFADTFSHRDEKNNPYDALQLGLGFGHGLSGSNPDYTYNKSRIIKNPRTEEETEVGWMVREDRTLAMELEMFEKLKSFQGEKKGGGRQAIDKNKLSEILVDFNKIQEHEGEDGNYDKKDPGKSDKMKLLHKKMIAWGIEDVQWVIGEEKKEYKLNYKEKQGESNRNKYLCNKNGTALKQEDYPGVILPKGNCKKEGETTNANN